MNHCDWCGEPAVKTIEVQPAHYSTKGGVKTISQFAIYAHACSAHAAVAVGQPPHVERLRRRRARNIPQMDIYDVLEGGIA